MASGSVNDQQATRDDNNNEQDRGFVPIPYVSGTSEALGRILGKAGFKVAMKPCRTLRQELVAPKDKIQTLDKAGVVYKIGCGDCEASYIGHTSKNLRDRVKQHKTATDQGKTLDSGVAEHAWSKHHEIDWDNVKVLDQESNEKRRLIKESLFIKSEAPTMNRDLGKDLSPAFLSFIHRSEGSSLENTTRGPSPADLVLH